MSVDVVRSDAPEPPEKRDNVSSVAPLASLRKRAEDARKVRYTYIPIPGFDPPASVRYRALEPEELEAITKRRSKLPDKEANKAIAADVCITACLAIFDLIDGQLVSIDPEARKRCYVDDEGNIVGDPVTFSDPRLSELLGLEDGSASKNVWELYPMGGDVLSAADKILRFSGIDADADAIEEMIRGNS